MGGKGVKGGGEMEKERRGMEREEKLGPSKRIRKNC
jgi:hypothetical protein